MRQLHRIILENTIVSYLIQSVTLTLARKKVLHNNIFRFNDTANILTMSTEGLRKHSSDDSTFFIFSIIQSVLAVNPV